MLLCYMWWYSPLIYLHFCTDILFVIFLVPNPVLNLTASPQSNSGINVEWLYPYEDKPHYKYFINANSATGHSVNKTIDNNSTVLSNLEPGSRYNISVTTIIDEEPGIKSTEEETFSYTSKTFFLNAAKLLKH